MTQVVARHLALYFVADHDTIDGNLVEVVTSALSGGAAMIQLRAKHLTDREFFDLGRRLREATSHQAVPLIINDRCDIALAAQADGVHLGVHDLPIEVARSLLGPDAIIGYSPETTAEITSAASRGASYLGIGPIFGTTTKADAGTALGSGGFGERRTMTNLPVVAIGGIHAGNAAEAIEAGGDGIAVVSAISRANDPAIATSGLRQIVDRALAQRLTR